jgi:hypothetical protein
MKAMLFALALLASTAQGQDADEGEHDWAPVPTGGTSWAVLGATEAVPWVAADGVAHLAPRFPAAVEALAGKPVAVAGFMLPLDDAPSVRHFALYASKLDCEFHMPPGPAHYVDVSVDQPLPVNVHALVVRGRLELVRARQGGVFYRISHATVSAAG